jgi:RNA-splicing ligase RtcB
MQLGTLGGGNHFIEAGFSDKPVNGKNFWITVHSGSRNFGLSIANFYQKKAVEHVQKNYPEIASQKNLAFLEKGTQDYEDYLFAMDVAQQYARHNRIIMLRQIKKRFSKIYADVPIVIESVHNYIDLDSMILRKGAISANEGETVLIPFNMRDGMIIGTGQGNADWNNSAPHGAGRLLARGKAKADLSMEQFKDDMDGIYTTCVSQETLDESPAAYKDAQMIANAIRPTVDIVSWVKPVYNFKASS